MIFGTHPNGAGTARPISWLALMLTGFAWGCGSSPPAPTSSQSDTLCPPGTQAKHRTLHQEEYRWCVTPGGEPSGPYRVTYADGRPKLSFELAQGRVQGVYRAFHPLGRRAVEQTYNAGSPEGVGRFWPPRGPELSCLPDECAERELTLGRPFCQPEQISASLKAQQAEMDRCIQVGNATDGGTVVAQWWLDLLGRPYAVQMRSSEEQRPAAQCLEKLIKGTTFAAPFGDVCSIRMPFKMDSVASDSIP